MSCSACKDTGHRPDAPWLLCLEECTAVARIRERSMTTEEKYQAAMDRLAESLNQPTALLRLLNRPYRGADRIPSLTTHCT